MGSAPWRQHSRMAMGSAAGAQVAPAQRGQHQAHACGYVCGSALPVLGPCQAAALAALQQRKAQQAAWQAREREALIINSAAGNDVANPGAQGRPDQRSMHNSGDSQGSGVGFAAASPPCLSPRHAPPCCFHPVPYCH